MFKSLIFAAFWCLVPIGHALSEEIIPIESYPWSTGANEETRERKPVSGLNNSNCESIDDYYTCTVTSDCYWSGSCHAYY